MNSTTKSPASLRRGNRSSTYALFPGTFTSSFNDQTTNNEKQRNFPAMLSIKLTDICKTMFLQWEERAYIVEQCSINKNASGLGVFLFNSFGYETRGKMCNSTWRHCAGHSANEKKIRKKLRFRPFSKR